MKRALALPLILAACVSDAGGPSGAEPPEEREVIVDGRALAVRQEADWPIMGFTVDNSGKSGAVQLGRGRTLLVFGAADRAQALKAVGQVCGVTSDPAAWDTQSVYRDPATGAFWFDGLCP